MRKRFEVCTVCHGRVLNCLCRKGVRVTGVRVEGRKLSFVAAGENVRLCEDALGGACFGYTAREVGVGAWVRSLWRRPALWIAALVVCAALGVALNVVWKTEVDCTPELAPKVYAALAEAGYASPRFRNEVDTTDVKNRLTAIDGVALASVRIKGVWLEVEVKEELPNGETAVHTGAIVAACDCVVTRIVVERGRAMVAAGDSVRKGDVLIAPEYLVDADRDVTLPTQAVGEVYGYTYPAYTYQYAERTFEKTRTGEAVRHTRITAFGHTFGEREAAPYPQYEEEVEKFVLGAWFPIEIERVTYYETTEQAEFRPFALEKERIIEECFAQIRAHLKKSVQILREWCIIDNMGSIYRVRAYAEVEQRVDIYGDEG